MENLISKTKIFIEQGCGSCGGGRPKPSTTPRPPKKPRGY